MKQSSSILAMFVLAGILIRCQQATPLQPLSSSLVGSWHMATYKIYDVPAWFVASHHLRTYHMPTDTATLYEASFGITDNVRSYSLSSGDSFRESHLFHVGFPDFDVHYNQGTWTATNSLVQLTVPSQYAQKLTYSTQEPLLPNMEVLVTEKMRQTAIVPGYPNFYEKPDTVSYII
ncbi:hypothetical protein BH09BAC4_BH09BAC4_06230 [soil metagenome]